MAARVLTAKATVKLTANYSLTKRAVTESGATPAQEFLFMATHGFTNGTGADQVQRLWSSKTRSLSSASENLDLFDLASVDVGAGAGLDSLGQAFALTGIKALYVHNDAASAVDLLVGGVSATTAWNTLFNGDDDAKLTIHPGGTVIAITPKAVGYLVADTANHLLKIEAAGGAATYDIAILGI